MLYLLGLMCLGSLFFHCLSKHGSEPDAGQDAPAQRPAAGTPGPEAVGPMAGVFDT